MSAIYNDAEGLSYKDLTINNGATAMDIYPNLHNNQINLALNGIMK